MEGLVRYQVFTARQVSNNRWKILLVLIYAGIFFWGLNKYLQWQSANMLLGLITISCCININRQFTGSRRFGYLSFLLLVLLVLMPVKTMLYLAVLSGVFYLLESYYGRLNLLPMLAVVIMSPFFQYLSNVFVFPIRLWLSEWAGNILKALGSVVVVTGNVLTIQGQEFSVDPACMGLNMLVVSLLLCIMLLGVYQKKYQLQVSAVAVFGMLLFTFVMNIISNMVRILMLVQFSIMPGELMHDVTGVVCLLVYVILPLGLLIHLLVRKRGKEMTETAFNRKVSLAPHIILAAFHLLLTIKVISFLPEPPQVATAMFEAAGYTTSMLDDDVVKLNNQQALIYIKPIRNFYNADHNPMICWKGSGYNLKHINTTTIAGLVVYTARLEKEKDVLYTSWWYDNGKEKTISQLQWRWNMMKGSSPYAIINITTSSPAQLAEEVKRFREIQN
ncbi:exosortase N [Aridibaculum aurantiacum]|uniref:exosortase N n=1 Tax=Aridibaculum aurantiacum TaxID=2810307 RepID=UPI001A95EE3D|nr:exosortase N [Aridibaculum aurantiacum]